MARQRTDLLSRLADAGEEAISRLGDAPGADRLLAVATNMRDRMDEMQRKMRGLEGMEKRLKDLERKVDQMGGGSKPASARSRRSSLAESPSAKARSTASKGASSGTRKKPSSSSSSRAKKS